MKNKIGKLEALRGFAAIYVVLHHLFSKSAILFGIDFSILFRFGQEAVIIFFFLSGFVIQHSYNKGKDKSVKSFIIKRALRIYIPLLLVFISSILLLKYSEQLFVFDWYNFLGNILMLQDVGSLKPNVLFEPFLGNTPLWSLSYEWWLYVMFILFEKLFSDKSSRIVYIIATVSAVTYIFYPNFFNREMMYLLIWWIGVEIARSYTSLNFFSFKTIRTPILVLLLNVFILFLNVVLHKNEIKSIGISPVLEFRHFVFALLSIFIALLWKKLNWFGFSKTIGIFEFIAPISFGIYISHWFLVVNAHYLDNIISNAFIRTVLYFLCCCIFSFIVERVIYLRIYRSVTAKLLKK